MKAGRMRKAPIALLAGVCLFMGCVPCPNRALAGPAAHVVVNEVHIDSIAGTGGSDDDWVELYNPTNQPVVLDGWSVQKSSETGTTIAKQALSGSISAGGYVLIVKNGAATSQALLDAADITAGTPFNLASDNIVYLVNDNINITGSNDANIIDFVGFGGADFYEGTAPAPAIAETKSISRMPDGEDTDQNSVDFKVKDAPTPMNSKSTPNSGIGGTVVLTITQGANPVQNITSNGAEISFQANANSTVKIYYGLTSAYGEATAEQAAAENTPANISIAGLECGKTYHYSIYAESATENDATEDAAFTTLPCGITLKSLAMTKTAAKANDKFADGWSWEFDLTIWNMSETSLKMKFDQWSGAGALNAGANMQFSADNGSTWTGITDNGAYPVLGADLSAIDSSADAGRQVKVLVRMKVPAGTKAGIYNSNYGILTE
jgi:hypothetical protein